MGNRKAPTPAPATSRNPRVSLGDRVRDRISGAQGIAIARTEWLYGCVRITIKPEKLDKDGKERDSVTIDEPQCEVLKVSVIENRPYWRSEGSLVLERAAGPRPDPVRPRDPVR